MNFNAIFKFMIAVAAALILSNLLMTPNPSVLGAAGFLVLLPLFFVKPEVYFIFFVIARPIVDLSLRGNLPGNKLSALMVIPLIILCGKDILLKPEYVQRIRESRLLQRLNFIFLLIFVTYLLSFIHTSNQMVSWMDFLRFTSVVVSINYAVVYFGQTKSGKERFINLILLS